MGHANSLIEQKHRADDRPLSPPVMRRNPFEQPNAQVRSKEVEIIKKIIKEIRQL